MDILNLGLIGYFIIFHYFDGLIIMIHCLYSWSIYGECYIPLIVK